MVQRFDPSVSSVFMQKADDGDYVEYSDYKKLLEDSQALRCRCGGELEGLGLDIKTKDEVWECKECNAQIIIVHKEAEKPK